MNKNLEILQEIFLEEFVISSEQVIPEANLEEDLGLDSLDQVKLCFEVEKVCETRVTDDEWSGIKTVDDLLRIMDNKTS